MTTLEQDFKKLAYYYSSLMDGDTHRIEEAYKLLRKHKLVDEDNFLICEDDEYTE